MMLFVSRVGRRKVDLLRRLDRAEIGSHDLRQVLSLVSGELETPLTGDTKLLVFR